MLNQKYGVELMEARNLASFLLPMLAADPEDRVKAQHHLNHPWLRGEPAEELYLPHETCYVQLWERGTRGPEYVWGGVCQRAMGKNVNELWDHVSYGGELWKRGCGIASCPSVVQVDTRLYS